jgi:hypothetical protein
MPWLIVFFVGGLLMVIGAVGFLSSTCLVKVYVEHDTCVRGLDGELFSYTWGEKFFDKYKISLREKEEKELKSEGDTDQDRKFLEVQNHVME